MEIDSDQNYSEIDIDNEHVGKIMRKIIENDNLRDLKIVAGLDKQK